MRNSGTCNDRMIDMARALGRKDAIEAKDFIFALLDLQKACGVNNLKMSDYGICMDEINDIVKNARDNMGGTI